MPLSAFTIRIINILQVKETFIHSYLIVDEYNHLSNLPGINANNNKQRRQKRQMEPYVNEFAQNSYLLQMLGRCFVFEPSHQDIRLGNVALPDDELKIVFT